MVIALLGTRDSHCATAEAVLSAVKMIFVSKSDFEIAKVTRGPIRHLLIIINVLTQILMAATSGLSEARAHGCSAGAR